MISVQTGDRVSWAMRLRFGLRRGASEGGGAKGVRPRAGRTSDDDALHRPRYPQRRGLGLPVCRRQRPVHRGQVSDARRRRPNHSRQQAPGSRRRARPSGRERRASPEPARPERVITPLCDARSLARCIKTTKSWTSPNQKRGRIAGCLPLRAKSDSDSGPDAGQGPAAVCRSTRGWSEVARSCGLLERWRPDVDRVRNRKEHPVVAHDVVVVGPAGGQRCGRIGNPRDAVRPHALRDRQQLGLRLCDLVVARAAAARQPVLAGLLR